VLEFSPLADVKMRFENTRVPWHRQCALLRYEHVQAQEAELSAGLPITEFCPTTAQSPTAKAGAIPTALHSVAAAAMEQQSSDAVAPWHRVALYKQNSLAVPTPGAAVTQHSRPVGVQAASIVIQRLEATLLGVAGPDGTQY